MSDKRDVLVIYTGGTIGMIKEASSGILAPFDFDHLQEQIPEISQLSAEVSTVAFEKPLDSSNMDLEHWAKMANIIKENYEKYDGFVILHGSDTMAYTASALSFMLENLTKPVILTGSQLPIGMVRTDGKENFITSIEIASHYHNGQAVVPEVCIYFEDLLYRGNRTFKDNTEHFEAFKSSNYPVLAEAGVHIKYNREAIKGITQGPFDIDTRMENRVVVLTLFPGISQHIIDAATSIPDNRILILRTYGSGNAMTYPWFLKAIENAIDQGIVVLNVSQCRAGGVIQGRYETSSQLERMGVISGGDMTFESAITKSMHLNGTGFQGADFARLFKKNIRGEITNTAPISTD